MRWIADDGKARIEKAVGLLVNEDCAFSRHEAKRELQQVLADVARLEKEQPNPAPRVVTLTPEELRRIYPERFIESI